MATKGMRLTARDLLFLDELIEVEFMDTPTVHERHFPQDHTVRACQRRLKMFVDLGLIHRIPIIATFADGRAGRLPTVYRPAPRGAELHAEITGSPLVRVSTKDPQPERILHRLGIAKLRLVVKDACALRQYPLPTWIDEYAARPGTPCHAPLHQRFVLCHRFPLPNGTTVVSWPDGASFLHIPTQAGAIQGLAFFWEYDRSTERLLQLKAKLPGLHLFLSGGVWRDLWPSVTLPLTARVAFVFQTEQRLLSAAVAFKDGPGQEFIRMTTVAELRPPAFFTAPIWRTVTGERRPILPSPQAAQTSP